MARVRCCFALIFWNLIFQADTAQSSILNRHLSSWDQVLETKSSDSSFDINIRNPDDKILSAPIPLHDANHRSIYSPPPTVEKRANYLQNHCPRSQTFISSRCLPHITPQAYEVICSRPHYVDAFAVVHTASSGNCAQTQICLQGVPPPLNPVEHAYCVDFNEPITLPQIEPVNGCFSMNGVEQGYASNGGSAASSQFMGAVLTGPDSRTSVFARSLGIQAQAFNMVKGMQVWETLKGGTNECENCSSVSVQPVPQGTKRVMVCVLLEAMSTAALLYVEKVIP